MTGSLLRPSTVVVKALALAAIVAVATGLLQVTGVRLAETQNLELTALAVNESPGLDPTADLWSEVPEVEVPLSGQLATYAMGGGSVPVVRVKAVHHQGTLYLRLEWDDATKNDSSYRPEDFADAAAVEFPAASATSVPSFCMGQPGTGVNIWHWRADSEAGVPDPSERYASAVVDTYPSTEDLFYPARAVGNPYAAFEGPVQNLVAQAFGTLAPAASQSVSGHGVYENGRWQVVFARPFDASSEEEAAFSAGQPTDVAFAVWDGANGERDGMKSVSQFVTLNISSASLGVGGESNWPWIVTAVALFLAFTLIGLAFAWYGYRRA